MARQIRSGAGDGITASGSITNNLTVAVWFNPDNAPVSGGLDTYGIGYFNGSNASFLLVWNHPGAGFIQSWSFEDTTNNFPTAQYTATFTPGVLTHVAGTWDGTTLRSYKDGSADATVTPGTNIRTGSATRMIAEGAGLSGVPGVYAEAGFWNVALDPAEIAALAKGYSPALIRPSALVDCWPLVRENISLKQGPLTIAAAPPVVPHPRIIMRSSQRMRRMSTAAAGGTVFPWAWAKGSNLPVLGTGTF
jgi:Concanavalin A-like lectin/glucanases superfamily